MVATVSTSFDAVTGVPLAQPGTAQNVFDVSSNNSGTNTVTKLILKDHLGSMVAEITLGGTPANPVVLVNTLSIHGFGPWGNARNAASALAEGQRGFTGHEHLAELGLIHMNGRLYDPVLGRFLQADPIIQAPHNAQSHNRYSYVLNNPLSFTDPSGFSAWTKWRSQVVSTVAGAIAAYFCGVCGVYLANAIRSGMNAQQSGRPVVRAIGASVVGTFAGMYGGPMVAAAVERLADGGNVQSALKAAFSAGISEQFGAAAGGCAGALLNGGSCWAGARDAMISAGIQAAQTQAYGYLVETYPKHQWNQSQPTAEREGEGKRAYVGGFFDYTTKGPMPPVSD